MNQLIKNIELLSNQKSFRLDINTIKGLWFLLHFKKFEILNTVIYHKQYSEFRQSKSTKYPTRRLTKKFANTADLLDYLSIINYRRSRNFYIYEIEFTNGWKIKESCHIAFTFYTNSVEERNTLINHLINSVAYDPIAIDSLEPNYSYYFNASGSLMDANSGFIMPDEFWGKDRYEKWKSDAIKEYYNEEVSDTVDIPFNIGGSVFPTNDRDIRVPF